MKKKLTFIIMLLLFCIMNVNAADIKAFYCEYSAADLYDQNVTVKFKVEVTDYNNGNGSSKVTGYIYNPKESKWKSNGTIIENRQWVIFDGGDGKTAFLSDYKKSGTCPKLTLNKMAYQDGVIITNYQHDPTNPNANKQISANDYKIKETENGEWKSPSTTPTNPTNPTTPKDERTCSYEFNVENRNVNNVKLEFITRTNPQNNQPVYVVNNKTGGSEQIVDLDGNDVIIRNANSNIRLTGDFLKKIFQKGACPAKDTVCSYWSNVTDQTEFTLSTDMTECKENSDTGNVSDGGGNLSGEDGEFDGNLPSQGFGKNGDLCSDILNENLSKLVKLCITILRIAGAVIAVVNGMIALIPAVVSKNPDALKKAGHKCMLMGVILLAIGVFPTLLRVIAKIFGYDVSCIF